MSIFGYVRNRPVFRELADLLGPLLPQQADGVRESEPATLIRCSQRAMATLFEVIMPFGQPDAEKMATRAFEWIDALEEQLTVYRDDSEVSRLNRTAYSEPVVVEDHLFGLLELAQRIHKETWGAFDITAGKLIRVWGFFHRQGRRPRPADRDGARQSTGMQHVALNAERRSIRYLRDGIEINLGSIGKGYALDRVGEQLRRGCDSFMLHAGGSSVVAAGLQPRETRGWKIAIRHPWIDGRSLGTVFLRDRALGTSAATYQHFVHGQKKVGHILDPRTGRPAEGIASATALAPGAAEADALATAFYVLGMEKTRLYCQTHSGIGAVLLADGDDAVPQVFGTAVDEFEPNPERVDAGVLS